MKLSLIICTRNRCQSLTRTLDAVDQLAADFQWETIVVDNGSTDQTRDMLESRQSSCKAPFSIVFEKTPGLANARNAGLKQSTGELVVFTDDDCLPDKNYLNDVDQVFKDDPAIGFFGGRILLFDPTDQPVTIQPRSESYIIEPYSFVEAGLIHGANFGFRRMALREIGGFDPLFGAGALFAVEDVDAIARLSATGWKGVYDPNPLVYHHHGRKTQAAVDQLERGYAFGRGAYYVKCMMSRQWNWQAWKHWYWSCRRKSFAKLYREILGAGSFLIRSWLDRGRRFRGAPS